MNKWGGAFWKDWAERVGSTLVYSLITLFATTQVADISTKLGWAIVGLPTVLAALKCIGANLPGPEPSASVVDVQSVNPS